MTESTVKVCYVVLPSNQYADEDENSGGGFFKQKRVSHQLGEKKVAAAERKKIQCPEKVFG